jgi:hypothetical protein
MVRPSALAQAVVVVLPGDVEQLPTNPKSRSG